VGSINSEEIISILKTEIENYDMVSGEQEVGSVIWVGDGIATIYGIEHAMYGEIVIFENGIRGMVQDIRRDQIGCIILGKDTEIKEGTKVTRTKKKAGVPVGNAYLGRIVNALGAPIDGKGEIPADDYRAIEQEAPGIVDRQSVNQPLETGILAIDAMFPIGRGQRELIIGDRQTGKTSIAVDTILNQKGKDVICIYVAIGQKASTVAKLVNTLTKHDALDYTVVLSATASESASLQYIAPYAGTALAEYFMYQGKDVLIVYDDLSKHAVAYRALSLLLERSPGREAYPGDVFYLHSRLLERSSKLSDALGGGSITALPIIETQAGDVSAYIPTNVISITDGQIFLESALFNAGNRPAVNVGLSVSRVGGAAQTKAMKKANANLRIELAQYKDMESFAQFSSDLDAETRRQLDHGKALMEMLKQPLYQPKSDAEQVVTLVLASHGVLDELPTAELRAKTSAFVRQFRADVSGTMDKITATGKLEPEMVDAILNAWKAYAGGDSHAVQ
jgi:F-type H+-transporting ATPase subunit alpha